MKRLLALILTAALALSLVACGGGGEPNTPVQDTPSNAVENPPASEKTIPGSYAPVGLVPGTGYEVNENGSYDHGEEKGTYTAAEDGSLTFQPKDGGSSTLTAFGDYDHSAVQMAEDTEYGLAPSFDESGHSNQTFQTKTDDTTLTLELHEDGSYVFSYSKTSPVFNKFSDVVVYEGTYTLENTVLNLNCKDNRYTFLFVDDTIYPIVYEKKADTNSAEIEAAQAAVLTAEEDAAKGRWWTPADETTTTAVKAALEGMWEYSGGYTQLTLDFSVIGVSVQGKHILKSYSIHNGAILLEDENRRKCNVIPYTYTDGNLTLYEMLGMDKEGLQDATADLTALSSYQYQKTN